MNTNSLPHYMGNHNREYCIVWENQHRPGRGRGTKHFTLAEATALARELNADHPTIRHWVEKAIQ